MWSRKRLDIGWSDLFFSVVGVCFLPDRAMVARDVERLWPDAEHTLACLSVRSGFDLMLGALNLPRGSEVLISAITIPDMIQIIEHHGLVPVPVDLDPQQMTPTVDDWQRAITTATKLILVAHLFGGRREIEPLCDLACQHCLMVIEDCAQAFAGTGYQGHSKADASMFSFGTIKSSTALGGAILRIRDRELLSRMRGVQAAYPVQSRRPYLKRLLKYAVLKAISCRSLCAMFVRACRAIGCDYDQWVNHTARGFSGDDFFDQIRRQPSSSLLAMLERRLRNYDARRSEQHTAKGKALATLFGETVFCPGATVVPHTYWVFPILVEEPGRMMEHLAQAGFDATQGHSLCVVRSPADRPGQIANAAERVLAKIVFLPFYPELPIRESQRMADAILGQVGIEKHDFTLQTQSDGA